MGLDLPAFLFLWLPIGCGVLAFLGTWRKVAVDSESGWGLVMGWLPGAIVGALAALVAGGLGFLVAGVVGSMS